MLAFGGLTEAFFGFWLFSSSAPNIRQVAERREALTSFIRVAPCNYHHVGITHRKPKSKVNSANIPCSPVMCDV